MPNNVTLTDLKPESFRVGGSDTKGHNRRLFFRTQPGHGHQADSIIQSKVFPYRRLGDLLRHALHRHLEWLESLAPIPSVTTQVDVILQFIRDEEFNSDFMFTFEALTRTIANYLVDGASGQAVRVMMEAQKSIAAMPDGYWKDKYTGALEEKFGYLVKEALKASLIPSEAEEDEEEEN